MRNTLIAAAGALAITAFAAPASAQHYHHDSIKDAPREVHNWTGFYVGTHVGYGQGTGESFVANPARTTRFDPTVDTDGFIAGGQAGFNLQIHSLVVGIEADIAGGDLTGDTQFVGFFSPSTTDAGYDVNWLATIRGRLGFTAGKFLVYGTGGLAYAGIESTFQVGGGIGRPGGTFSETRSGYVAGGGIEYALSQHVSLKAEYLYIDLEDKEYRLPSGWFGSELDLETAKVGINYRF